MSADEIKDRISQLFSQRFAANLVHEEFLRRTGRCIDELLEELGRVVDNEGVHNDRS